MALFATFRQQGIDDDQRAELCLTYTQGRSSSTKDLTYYEARQMLQDLNRQQYTAPRPQPAVQPQPTDRCTETQRRQVCSLMHTLKWYTADGRLNFGTLTRFMARFPDTYPVAQLNALSVQQCSTLINQLTALL